MNKIKLMPITTAILTGSFLVSCLHDPPDVTTEEPVCFQKEVLPIFQNACGSCHSPSKSEEGYDFTSYGTIMKAVKPFNAAGSEAYKVLTGKPFTLMPPSGPLSSAERMKIWYWIQQGAMETTCGSDGTVTGVSYTCFTRDILPVLSNSCGISGCHNPASAKEGIVLTSYASVMSSDVIKSGNPGSSDLYEVITASPSSEDIMPPKPYSPLPKAVTDSIFKWIQRGAKNEICAAKCDTTGAISFATHILPVVQASCQSCHSGSSPSGNLKLTTYAEVVNAVKNGKLLGAIKRSQGFTAMPPSTTLSTCDIRKFELWKSQNYAQ